MLLERREHLFEQARAWTRAGRASYPRHMRGPILLLLLPVAATVAAQASAAPSPGALRTSIRSAALARSSVHYVNVAVGASGRLTIVADVARDRGRQQITWRLGKKTSHLTIVVAGGAAYLHGDAVSLQRFHFRTAAATKYAGVWIRIPPTSSAYGSTAAAVTLASTVDELAPQGQLTAVAPTTLAGRRVVGIRGRSAVGATARTVTLYARASGAPLPVKEVVTAQSFRSTFVLSRWNEPVRVRAPAKSVALSTVLAYKGGPAA